MTTFSYPLAKTLLSETEKERIVCVYLNSTDPTASTNWDKAAEEFGSASVQSFRKLMSNTTKKLKEATNSGVQPEAVLSPAKKKGKKRQESQAELEGDMEESPKKKGKKGKGKKAAEGAGKDDVKVEAED